MCDDQALKMWEQDESRSQSFRVASMMVSHEEWEAEQDSRSELFRQAAAVVEHETWSNHEDRSPLFQIAQEAVAIDEWSEHIDRSPLFQMAQKVVAAEEWEQDSERSDLFKVAKERIDSLERQRIFKQASEVERPRCAALLLAVAHMFRDSQLHEEERQELKRAILQRSVAVYTALSAYEKHLNADQFLLALRDIAGFRIRQASAAQKENEVTELIGQTKKNDIKTQSFSPVIELLCKSNTFPDSPQGVGDFDSHDREMSPTTAKLVEIHPRAMSFLEL